MKTIKRNCDHCDKEYNADKRNLKRGWGLCCSKPCAAHKREKSRHGYDPVKVKINNAIRNGDFSELSETEKILLNQKRFRVDAPSIYSSSGIITRLTSEGYRVMDGVAYDEYDSPVYNYDPFEDEFDHGQW